MSCFIAGMLSIPTMLNAANFISLDEHEKKLITQGDIITREIDAVEVKAGAQDNGAQLLINATQSILPIEALIKFPGIMPSCCILLTGSSI